METTASASGHDRTRDLLAAARDGRRLTPSAASRHTKLVGHLRLVVPAAAFGLVCAYAVAAVPEGVDREFTRQFAGFEAPDRDLRLAAPRYLGEDRQGVPFEAAADSATRERGGSERITLDNPQAVRAAGSEGDAMALSARRGLYDAESGFIDLTDDVEFKTGEGDRALTFVTPEARYDSNARTMSSEAGVRGTGAQGDLSADAFTIFEDEGRVVLEGNVKLRLEPRAAEADAAETPE